MGLQIRRNLEQSKGNAKMSKSPPIKKQFIIYRTKGLQAELDKSK